MSAPRPFQPLLKYLILHIDDDPDSLKIAKRHIEKADSRIQVISTTSPREALLMMVNSPDCILSDYKMPEMDGITLARKVRETSSVPFILYTGRGSEAVAEAAFEVGVDDYLRKESDSSHYLILVNRIIAAVEKHRIEVGLRSALTHYQALFISVSDAVFLIDPFDYSIISANKAALGDTGESEALLGRHCYELFHEKYSPCEQTGLLCPLRETLKTGESTTVVHTHSDMEGRLMYVEVSTHPVRGPEGKIVQLLLISRDITQRKRTEERLRESEARLKNIFSASPDAITVTDLNGNIVECNQATLDLHGFTSKEDVIGLNAFEFIAEKDQERAMENLKLTLHEGSAKNLEYTCLTKNGRKFQAELSVAIMSDSSDEGLSFVGITKDISKRKEAERMLLEYMERLEEMVDEKSKELLEAERIAVAGQVAAMVGHDLRNPLQTIMNTIHLLKKNPGDADELLEIIERTIGQAVHMLDELRHQTQPLPIDIEPVNLASLIERAVSESYQPPSIDVMVNMGDGLEAVPLDFMKMRRVLDNLIRNAVEGMPDGGVLTIDAGKSNGMLSLRVSDSGVGISRDEIPELFKLFHTTKSGGVGLGLAFCKRAIEAHGGTIDVESIYGEGTSIILKIPLSDI